MLYTRRGAASLLAGGLMAVGVSGLAFAKRSALFDLDDRPLGLQLYTLGDEFSGDSGAMFAALYRLGYRRFECNLAQLAKPEFHEAATRNGMMCNSVHIEPMALRPENAGLFGDVASRVAEAGVDYAGISIFPFDPLLLAGGGDPIAVKIARIAAGMSVDEWKRVADTLNLAGENLKAAGARMFYHNHNLEFHPLQGTTPFQILLDNTDPALVAFQVDVGWVATAGLDPVAVIEAAPDRFRLMHVKDIARDTKPNFALDMVPANVGAGTLDWPAIIAAARKAGVTEFFVEQEPPFSGPRIDAVEASARYLLGKQD